MFSDNRLIKNTNQSLTILLSLSLLGACATPSAIDIDPVSTSTLNVPDAWDTQSANRNLTNNQNKEWLDQVVSPELLSLIELAVKQNHGLNQTRFSLKQAEQRITANGASFWPSLDLSFDTGTRHSSTTDTRTDSSDLTLSARYELDIWGKLGEYEQQLNLDYQSKLTGYEQEKSALVRDVIIAWYQVVESSQQLTLFEQRFTNVKNNLAVIESGYESGLNSALDVYLSRNEVASEQAKVASQKTTLTANIRVLELLVGQYPDADANVSDISIPSLTTNIALGLPSDVVKNNPQIQSLWMRLMSQDAALAYAHKQRFPSLTFTASAGYASTELSDLLSNNLGWSLFGGITAPIFNAGRLAANEEAARLSVKETEQGYLAALYSVFSNIENGITKTQNLAVSLAANNDAATSAELAEQISFEQYLKGLVTYTTVLDAQSRAFNAQSALISLKFQALSNQLELYTNLGGNFQSIIDTEATQVVR